MRSAARVLVIVVVAIAGAWAAAVARWCASYDRTRFHE